MVESRMLYVGTEESMLLYPIFFALYEKAMCNIHPLCSQRSTPTWPFDVKPQTRIPKEFADPRVARQLLPTMSSAHSSHLYYFPSAYAVSGGDDGLYIMLLHIGNQGLPAGCVEFAHYVIQEQHRIFPCFLSDELNF